MKELFKIIEETTARIGLSDDNLQDSSQRLENSGTCTCREDGGGCEVCQKVNKLDQ